jgi:hypothetical protein
MSQLTTDRVEVGPAGDGPSDGGQRPRRRVGRIVLIVGLVLLLVVGGTAAVLWFGRDEARERRDDEALDDFRQSGAVAGAAEGRPAAGVYTGTAEGQESIGLPGMDESLGPNAPVTITHGDAGCFTYRVDLNTHHWRTWSFCPEGDVAFALVGLETYSTRDVPGLDLSTRVTYTCETPVPYLWTDPEVGDRREGACTGVSDQLDGPTADAGVVEVLEVASVTVAGRQVDAVRVRSTDELSGAQTGTEVDEWWLDAATGLPLRLVIDSRASSDSPLGSIDYVETASVELTSLEPRT